MQENKKKYPGWIRWSLFIYSIIAFLITAGYTVFHLYFFKINWERYENNNAYWYKANKILQHGVFRIKGQELALHSFLLIGLLVMGIIISIWLFVFAWRTYYARTLIPLIATFSYVLPLIPFGTNVLLTLIIAYIFILIGSALSVSALKLL
ncbi:transporter [Lactococcus hircilactis]|uniref:transporter n=1 Tax=Lactococcus hircilactis TaxID=1494462 RepID=UPI003FA2DABF